MGDGANIAQNVIWSGVPVATPAAPPEEVSVASASLPRAFLTATSVVTLASPGTIAGGTVTVNAGDLTVDHSNTGAAQGGITAAQGLSVGSISASPAVLALLQNPALLTAAALQATAPHPGAQTNAIASGTVTTTVGASAPTGTAGTFTTNASAASSASSSGEGGTTLALPAPDLSTVQGAWAALNAQKVNTVITDWAALSARGSSGLTANLSAISQVPSSSAIKTDTSTSALAAGVWVQRDSQGLAQINSAAVQLAQQKAKTQREADAALRDPTQITITGGTLAAVHGDLALDATGSLILTNTQVRAKEGVAHLYGSQGVTIASTQTTQTSTRIDGQIQTLDHAAVAGGPDSEGQAAYTETISSSVTTTTTTQTVWGTSSVDAAKIDIQSGQGSVTIDSSDLKASNGIRISAAQDVNILAQRGINNTSSSTANASQQMVGGSWDGGGTQQLVTTTTDGPSSNQETLRSSSLDAGSGQLSIEALTGNITGQSAQLSGNKVVLVTGTPDADGHRQGGGSIALQSLQVQGKTMGEADASTGTSALTTQTLSTVHGTLNATGDGKGGGITLSANQDLTLGAVALNAGTGDIYAQAGGNLNLNANADFEQRNQSTNRSSGGFLTSTTTRGEYQKQEGRAATTSLAGNNITLKAGDTLTNYAAEIDGKGTVLQIAGNSALTYTAKEFNAYAENIQSSTRLLGLVDIGSSSSTTNTLDTKQLGSKIFGEQVGIKAKNVEIVGADVVAKDLLSIAATDSVSITAATNTSSMTHSESKSEFGFSGNLLSGISVGVDSSSSQSQQSATSSSASNLSGANVSISSGANTTITASTVIATKDVAITAGGNLNVLAATNTQTSSEQSQSSSTRIGVVPGVARQTLFSNSNTSGNGEASATTQSTSLVSANTGNLTMVSGGTLTSQGAQLQALDTVTLVGKSVDLQAITDTSTSSSHFEASSFSVGSAMAGTVGSKVTAITDNLQIADNTSNERLKGAAALKAGYDAYKFVQDDGIKKLADGVTDTTPGTQGDPGGAAVGISFSVGSSSSKQDSASASSSVRGTSIQANTINITATEGDITATAAKLQGADISLDAKKDINLMAGVNTADIKNSSESHNVGAGVTIGIGQQSGISFQLSASQANGNANGAETTFDNTLVTATNTLTVKSGNNTNLVGAQLAGDKVKMDVGGDLNVVTLQDTSNFASEQHSSGINLSLCIPPLCYGNMVTGSISKSDSTIDHNYISATGQSGIAAGAGGYDITVKGNTDLVGGAITSKAPTDQSSLTTGSLTSSDLANNQSTNSSSSSISLGYSGGSAMSTLVDNAKTNTLTALAGGAGMPANGTQAGVTQSVIGNGTVTITGTGDSAKDANSATQVATLTTRDATKANGALTNTLTLQQAQDVQAKQKTAAENAQAANMVGGMGAQAWGEFADGKFKEAVGSGNETAISCWAPSGACRAVGHATVGGATGGPGGALGAGASSVTTPYVLDALISAGVPPEVAQALTTTGATVLGNAVGGADGAVAANNEASNNGVLALGRGAVLASRPLATACARSPACVRIVGADALAAIIGTGIAATVTLGDVNPTVFGGTDSFETVDGNKQPTHTGNSKPTPNLGSKTTTPGDALVSPGAPGMEAPSPLPGNNATVTPNNGPVAPITTGGFGEGTQPVASPIVMSTGQNPPVQPVGPSVNGTTIALNGNAVPVITPGSLPPAAEASVVSTLNNIQAGTQPAGPLGTRWGVPFHNRDGDLPAGQYQEYRLPPSPGQSGAGTNRIVVDNNTGATYLTWTHYGDSGKPAFVRIK